MAVKMRNPQQYQAITVIAAVPDIPKREVAIAFRGDEREETYDLAVVVPAGIIAGMVLSLHAALAKIDAQVKDTAGLMQPVRVTGAHVANPVMGHSAVLLRADNFQVPVVMTKEAALQTIAALEQAVELLDLPPSLPKQLS